MLSFQQIFHIIISECRNSCSNAKSAYEYFEKYYADKVDLEQIKCIAETINFYALRNWDETLYEMTK